MKYLFGVILAVLLLSGCATQSFDVNPPLTPLSQADLEESQPFFIYGVAQSTITNAADICGGAANVARIEVEQTALDSVLSWLTFSVYTPRTARVYCL